MAVRICDEPPVVIPKGLLDASMNHELLNVLIVEMMNENFGEHEVPRNADPGWGKVDLGAAWNLAAYHHHRHLISPQSAYPPYHPHL